LRGRYTTPEGDTVRPAFDLLVDRLNRDYTPEKVSTLTSIPTSTIRRLAREMGAVAMHAPLILPIRWTDVYGQVHERVEGRPVAFHAMRGLASHSNGFQTIRALYLLMMLLGTVDSPGGFRYKSPFPKPIPPLQKTINRPDQVRPNKPLPAPELGYPTCPEDLMLDEGGNPIRIDKAFSWEYPIAAHGLIHSILTNAYKKDPYPIDTLMIFMANIAWNSSMATLKAQDILRAKEMDGSYVIPHVIVSDAFWSETVLFGDLILPDTTYFERYEAISLLDRPSSDYDGPADTIRYPLEPPKGDCKHFGDILVELGSRLGLEGLTDAHGKRLYRDYEDFIINWETTPGSGVGFLAGWRGKNGEKQFVGEPNPNQWKEYIKHKSFFKYTLPPQMQYYRMINRDYLEWSVQVKFNEKVEPILLHFYSEILQKFRLAGQGLYQGRKPTHLLHKKRLATYFDPIPFWYELFEVDLPENRDFPLFAITQRPMFMYHSWDSQNAWLRQIMTQNFLYMNPQTARKYGIADHDWVWLESRIGKIRCQAKFCEATQPDTVWTWNAIGKYPGAWKLSPNTPEVRKGFLLNHIISEVLPTGDPDLPEVANGDPVTGHASWYDLRVRIYKAEEEGSYPQLEPIVPELMEKRV
jgi:anaerobic selenocysteine-containing dehydrogenase